MSETRSPARLADALDDASRASSSGTTRARSTSWRTPSRNGAVGATSNPVIVYTAVKADPKTWRPVLDALIAEHPERAKTRSPGG